MVGQRYLPGTGGSCAILTSGPAAEFARLGDPVKAGRTYARTVRTQDKSSDVPEVLEIGDDVPPADREVLLSAATVLENPNLLVGSAYLVTLGNVGQEEVTIEHASIEGWPVGPAWSDTTTVPAGSWAEVPVHVDFDCRVRPPSPKQVVVRGRVGDKPFRQIISLSGTARSLAVQWENRCAVPPGRAPTLADLEGVWLVEEGESLEGTIQLRFLGDSLMLRDGTEEIRFSSDELVARFSLVGTRLTAETETGYHCRFGDRWEWAVTLSEDDRLYVRSVASDAVGCRRDLGRAWVARRLEPAQLRG